MKKVSTEFDYTVLLKAIKRYGYDMQTTIAVEELSELQKEICKAKRGNCRYEKLVEELADVYIMLEQLKIMEDIRDLDVNKTIEKKIDRLKKRMDGNL